MKKATEFNYCALIDRACQDGRTDFTDLPLDDLEKLKTVANAALTMPYVKSARISEKTREIDGKPWWGREVYRQFSRGTTEFHTGEDAFKRDLRAALNDDQLFQELYQAKEEYKRLIKS